MNNENAFLGPGSSGRKLGPGGRDQSFDEQSDEIYKRIVQAATEKMAARSRLDAAANAWMDANPVAMGYFEKFALQMMARNKMFGIDQLAGRVRWEVDFEHSETGYKVNNNHRAYIARRLIAMHPALAGLIRLRQVMGEDRDGFRLE